MTAWALLVVSSEAQAETIPHQRAWARETASAQGWTIDRHFQGVSSGKDDARKLARELLSALKDAPVRPAWLLMTRLDRLGRNALECQIILRDIHALGVKVWTRQRGEAKADTAMERLVSAVELYVGEQENDVRRDKLKNVYKRKREAGQAIGNRRPYGLVIGADKKDAPVPDLADAVKLAFSMRIEGSSMYAIAKKLLEVAPPYRFVKAEKPVRWTQARVKRLLTNRAYIGTIVDELTFLRAQKALGTERPPRKYVWLLAGVLRCFCGRAMAGNVTLNPRGDDWRYYRCYAVWNHDGRGRSIRADALESQFAGSVAKIVSGDALAESYRAAPSPAKGLLARALPEAKRRLEEIDRERARVWAMNAKGQIRDDDLQARLDDLAPEREALVVQIAELSAQHTLATHSRRIDRDARSTLRRAATEYASLEVHDRARAARIIATLGGGLCCEEDGELTFRTPVDPGLQNPGKYSRNSV